MQQRENPPRGIQPSTASCTMSRCKTQACSSQATLVQLIRSSDQDLRLSIQEMEVSTTGLPTLKTMVKVGTASIRCPYQPQGYLSVEIFNALAANAGPTMPSTTF